MQYWLMKSEPQVYPLEQLQKDKQTGWEGVRNYQARNLMRDQMAKGDKVLFYHSSCPQPGVAGLAKVNQTGVVDPSQFDPQSDYYDPKATPEAPRWVMVNLKYDKHFKHFVSLETLRQTSELEGMVLLQKGSRLSVQPVSEPHFKLICKLGGLRV